MKYLLELGYGDADCAVGKREATSRKLQVIPAKEGLFSAQALMGFLDTRFTPLCTLEMTQRAHARERC